MPYVLRPRGGCVAAAFFGCKLRKCKRGISCLRDGLAAQSLFVLRTAAADKLGPTFQTRNASLAHGFN